MLVYDPKVGWEYEHSSNEPHVGVRCKILQTILNIHPNRFDRYGVNTQRAHSFVFRDVTPIGCNYFAGNYRGSKFEHLENYGVKVDGDPKVGTFPSKVAKEMREFDGQLEKALVVFAKAVPLAAAAGKSAVLLARMAAILANFLQKFLTIHPYANGNGHMGRLLVAVLLGRFGYQPAYWPVDDRPPYSEFLMRHRRGDSTPLINFILSCITGIGLLNYSIATPQAPIPTALP